MNLKAKVIKRVARRHCFIIEGLKFAYIYVHDKHEYNSLMYTQRQVFTFKLINMCICVIQPLLLSMSDIALRMSYIQIG